MQTNQSAGGGGDMEADRDPGAQQPNGLHHRHYGEVDFQGHRAHSVYDGARQPTVRPAGDVIRRSQHRRRRRHRTRSTGDGKDGDDERPSTPPAQRVQYILGDEAGEGGHEPHSVFSEMVQFNAQDMEWKEVARWVKFEEDVEEGGNRWSKPHVATLSLHSLFEFRSLLTNGTVMLDMEPTTPEQLADLLVDQWVNAVVLPFRQTDQIKDILLARHRHQHERKKDAGAANGATKLPIIRSLADIGRSYSRTTQGTGTGLEATATATGSLQANGVAGDDANRANTQFMRKLPSDVEACNVLIGELDELEKPLVAMVRLGKPCVLGDLTEVPIPTRFVFVLLGPTDPTEPKESSAGKSSRYREVGRSVGALMADDVFRMIAYKAKKREHLLAGLDEFLDSVTILPPGEWDPAIRIEPPSSIPSQEPRKQPKQPREHIDEEELEHKMREESGLTRSGRLFGGLLNDIKRKAPWYLSDFTDAISVQCIASWIFLYFACLTPIITFGGLLGDATGNNMAAMESLVSGAVVGVVWALFSGQPLTIMGSTGPVLVFETILHDFCLRQGWNYLSFRFCIGAWVGIILILFVALDLSYTVCYITRFTEENFACLIAFIFVYKAIEKLFLIGGKYPMNMSGVTPDYSCFCNSTNATISASLEEHDPFKGKWGLYAPKNSCETDYQGILEGAGCLTPKYYPDVFLMSALLFIGTFVLSVTLKDMKTAPYFPTKVRAFISDFAVIVAIGSMSLLDLLSGVKTPKLGVPEQFAPTRSDRGWIITPFGDQNPWWSCLAAILPALLAVILIFMDQQITAVIVNRKENRLKKGCGYHLDLFVLSILIIICSMMGIPWFVAATVLSINHVNSLKVESECAAPGEKPQFLGVREQRLTGLLIFLTIGLSVFMTSVLKHIPMPVLYGVFLYMGVSSLKGLQFFDRILIMFMPPKYQPDYFFLRKVPIRRVHLYTSIQLACFALLWIIKSFKETSILFPIMLVVMIGVRKLLDFMFSPSELRVLDDLLPDFKRKVIEKAEEKGDDADEGGDETSPAEGNLGALRRGPSGNLAIPLANGNIMKIPAQAINISDEVNKSGIWKHVNSGSNSNLNGPSNNKPAESPKNSSSGDKNKNRAVNEKGTAEEHRRLSYVPELEEAADDHWITMKADGAVSKSSVGSKRPTDETNV